MPIEATIPPTGDSGHYIELAPPTQTCAPPPRFIFGPLPPFLARDLFSEVSIGGVGCYCLRNAAIMSDGIILQHGAALWSRALNHPDYHVRHYIDPNGLNRAALPVRRLPGKVVVLHGPGYNVFGHWLVDFLPRLFVLHQAGFAIETLRFVLPADTPRFAHALLEGIGVDPANILPHDHKAELLQPDEVLVPTVLRLASRLSPLFAAASHFWFARFMARASSPPAAPGAEKLFVTRRFAASHRTLRNRAQIEAMAVDAGFTIVRPESQQLAEQFALFRAARQIAGEYGSGLHLAMFAPPGAITCALRGTSHHPGFVQSGLAEAFGQQVGYVLAPTPEEAGDHVFDIEPDGFARALDSMELWAARPEAKTYSHSQACSLSG